MGLLGLFKKAVSSTEEEIVSLLNTPANRKAVYWAAAYTAASPEEGEKKGNIDDDEIEICIDIITSMPYFKEVDKTQAAKDFGVICSSFSVSQLLGKFPAKDAITAVDDEKTKEIIPAICLQVAMAGGKDDTVPDDPMDNVSTKEKEAIVEICNWIGKSPSDYGL